MSGGSRPCGIRVHSGLGPGDRQWMGRGRPQPASVLGHFHYAKRNAAAAMLCDSYSATQSI
jgi:hypothetical protein